MDPGTIQRLGDPGCYPGRPETVDIIQTHLSVVCLAGDHAYKLKKPIRLPFADFSTSELRKFFCREELRLNRRLCPNLYLDVVPLFRNPAGISFRHEGGPIIDHAVHMRRLPQDRMMDEVLAREEVTVDHMDTLAHIMAAFHHGADRGPEVLAAGDPAHLRQYARDNFVETRGMCGTIFDPELHGHLEERTESDFEALLPDLKARHEAGRVVDGHGDLHARNICLTDPPMIYDCVEFCPGFRCEDVATENAFLVMDLVYRGHPELATRYVDAYIEESGDTAQRRLLPALVRYRAMVRAKVAAIQAGEEEIPEAGRDIATASARKHLNLAAASATAEQGPLLVLACGLPAAGKTTLFDELSRETAWRCVTNDVVRKELAGRPASARLPGQFYSSEYSQCTYAESLERAVAALGSGPVLVDASFRTAAERARALATARDAGAGIVIVWLDVSDEIVHARMKARAREDNVMSDADWAVYQMLKPNFEPPDGKAEGFPVLRLDAAAALQSNLPRLLGFLLTNTG